MKLALTTGILFVVCIGLVCERQVRQAQLASRDAEIAFLQRMPSIIDIQERLNEIDPNNPIPVDGKLGPDYLNSKTQAKWDKIVFNQYAEVYFEPDFYVKGVKNGDERL